MAHILSLISCFCSSVDSFYRHLFNPLNNHDDIAVATAVPVAVVITAVAVTFAVAVLVFNCDEALESTSMVRIFIGIVKCGAWGCFDEFNRLKEDQLSAISQQIQIIQDAIKQRTSPIQLLGRSINVDFNSGIFVTLNPAGKGYGGRSRLPDNLKALFRPVAMGAPDNELIAEVSLVTEGFTQAKDLASKIVSLFRLSKQLLSAQQHYDWGLRALKAVLNSGGKLIQYYKTQGGRKGVDAELEYEILIKAVRVNTLSKLTFADTSKFLSLIGDVFPGVQSSDITGTSFDHSSELAARRFSAILLHLFLHVSLRNAFSPLYSPSCNNYSMSFQEVN